MSGVNTAPMEAFAEAHGLVSPNKVVDLHAATQPQLDTANESLMEKYGRPFFVNAKGAISAINESFWAGLFAKENIMLYEPSEEKFYFYEDSNGLYKSVSDEAVFGRMSARILQASREWQKPALEKFRSVNCVKGIVTRYLKAVCEVPNAFARDEKNYLHLENGVIALSEPPFKLLPFSPKYRSTHASPIKYVPGAKCDLFVKKLLGPLDAADRTVIQKLFGQMLLGENICQRILILDGPGDDGKSQLSLLISEVIGTHRCVKLRTRQLEERFEASRFLNRTLLMGVDVTADFLGTPTAYALKGLVGGDLQDAEKKGSNEIFQYRGILNSLVTSNARQKARIEGDVAAWRRRLLIIRYESKRKGAKIPDFHKVILEKEGPGVLNWALQGMLLLLKDIKKTGDIVICEKHKKIVDDLLQESDSLRIFFRSEIQSTSNSSDDLSTMEIIERYANFCVQKRWNMVQIKAAERLLPDVTAELFGICKVHDIKRGEGGKSKNGFSKVKFRDPNDPDPTDMTDM